MSAESGAPARYLAYEPREVAADAPWKVGAFRLKSYRVWCSSGTFDASRFDDAEQTLVALPERSAPGHGLPGVGFVIRHQGLTGDYLVLAWWDHENELPLRVWVHEGRSWRPAYDGESVCVWDLEIFAHERNAWIETGLSGMALAATLPEYLSRTIEQTGQNQFRV